MEECLGEASEDRDWAEALTSALRHINVRKGRVNPLEALMFKEWEWD